MVENPAVSRIQALSGYPLPDFVFTSLSGRGRLNNPNVASPCVFKERLLSLRRGAKIFGRNTYSRVKRLCQNFSLMSCSKLLTCLDDGRRGGDLA